MPGFVLIPLWLSRVSENQTYPCGECGELLKSKVARRRHQTYACPKSSSYLMRMTLDTSQDRFVDSDGKRSVVCFVDHLLCFG